MTLLKNNQKIAKKIISIAFFSIFLNVGTVLGQDLSVETLKNFELLPEELVSRLGDNIEESDAEKMLPDVYNIQNNDKDKENEESSIDPENRIFGFDFFAERSESKSFENIPVLSSYQISIGDELELQLIGTKDSKYSLKVDAFGNAIIPEIGSISVGDLSLQEASVRVQQVINDSYIATKSFLSLKRGTFKRVSIIGAVKNPGTYILSPYSTVVDAIRKSGGLLDNASLRNIELSNTNGEKDIIDLYEFLIFGKLSKDSGLSNSSVINVPASNNFFKLRGAINRPMIYEFKKSDTLSDIIYFGQGLTSYGKDSGITVNALIGGQITSKLINKDDKLDFRKIEDIFIPSLTKVSNKEVLVSGRGVTTGYFSKPENNKLVDLIERLSFGDDIYPFYFLLSQKSNSGMKVSQHNLSLADPETYKDILLEKDVEIIFLSRDEVEEYNKEKASLAEMQEEIEALEEEIILNSDNSNILEKLSFDYLQILEAQKRDTNIFEENNKLEEIVPSSSFLSVYAGDSIYTMPATGMISAGLIVDYLKIQSELDYESTSVFTGKNLNINSFEEKFNFKPGASIAIPSKLQKTLTVTIVGQVNYPGTYTLDKNSTLLDLYNIAGGFTNRADERAIFLSRVSIKNKERQAYSVAKDLILDSVISQINNPVLQGQGNIDLGFLNLLDDVETEDFAGRVSGNLSYNSSVSEVLQLEDLDFVAVPPFSKTVSISGEVLSASTLTFEENATVEDYLARAGGLTKYADRNKIFILKSDGTSTPNSTGIFRDQYEVQPGDTIVVPRDLDVISTLPLVSVAAQILSNIALSAASLNAITN